MTLFAVRNAEVQKKPTSSVKDSLAHISKDTKWEQRAGLDFILTQSDMSRQIRASKFSKFPRLPSLPTPESRPPRKRQKSSAAFCPRASCGRRTELVEEGEEEEDTEEEGAVSTAAAPLIISSVAAGRVTIDSTTLPPPPWRRSRRRSRFGEAGIYLWVSTRGNSISYSKERISTAKNKQVNHAPNMRDTS